MYQGFKDLKVYQLSFKLGMEIFQVSKNFPSEEKYSLTDQVRRSSRSVPTNIAEAYRKRRYPKHFVSKLTDSDAECSETLVWVDFAIHCGYINEKQHAYFNTKYEEVGKMLGSMIRSPDKFLIQ
ncbi:MAG: four helix bundle protein [Gracilimonas sp.]|nr:four helix bundle protein [Gracilimonas sp.]